MPGTLEEPILSRLNRLDNILRELEDIRSGQHSPKSSYASTTSSGTLTSDGRPSLPEISPERLEKRCRPVEEVMMEVEKKGNLIDRLLLAEDRILKLCLQMEEEYHHDDGGEEEKSKELKRRSNSDNIKSPRKSLKQLVKSCVRPKSNR